MSTPDVVSFHLGIVVREIEPAMERYRAMLGVQPWRTTASPTSGLKIAYGRGAGQTFELIEVQGEGTTQFHTFLKERGEGVQHIGFWAPDMRAAVERALNAGAAIVNSSTDPQGNTVVQLQPAASVLPADLETLGRITYMDAGLGGVRIEDIGRGAEGFMRDFLKEDFDTIVIPPPWLT